MKQILQAVLLKNFVRFSFCLLLIVLIFSQTARAGFLYVYNQTGNSIYGYSVNERTGALRLLGGFPVVASGTGSNSSFKTDLLNIDPVNNRLYVISDGSDRVNAYSINPATGALAALPFSPIQLPAGVYNSVQLNPSGSLLAVNELQNSTTRIYAITQTSATLSQTLPFNVSNEIASNTVFSRDGNYFYQIAGGGTFFRGFNVNQTTGFVTEMFGSPFSPSPGAGALTDSQGRIFGFFGSASPPIGRVFTTNQGVPAFVHQSPIANQTIITTVLHPNERFIAAVSGGDRVFSVRINGTGGGTTLMLVADSTTGGSNVRALVFNQAGNFVFGGGNRISTFNFFRDTGGITLNNVQPQDTNGFGNVPGLAYLPTGIPVYLSGRVTDAGGRPISGARVTATDATNGTVQTALTNAFGYYIFDELILDRSYTVEVRQKQFAFAPQSFTANQESNELNFSALP
ncbi:MAG TPA: carboxypeptidase regulatory-like domain-containing protein [Pyrinomonadaceae bacterium]